MKYELLKEVIQHLENYEKEEKNLSIEGFTVFLNQQLSLIPPVVSPAGPGSDEVVQEMDNQAMGFENHITYLLGMMGRYAKHYVKEGFKNLPLKSTEDFGFLVSLSENRSMTKTELIQKNISEIPSGMEIIKRLSRKGLIQSFNDPNDGRAKRLQLTAQGKGVLYAALGELGQIAKIIAGDLSLEERITLLSILEKLNHFHKNIHENDWKSDLKTVEKKYVLPALES